MTVILLTVAFVVLVLLGVPITFSMLGASALALLTVEGVPWTILATRTLQGIDSFVLVAIPLFIFAGMLMDEVGLSERLMLLARRLTGGVPGGLPMSVVLATMLNSGLSGSTVGDVATMMAIAHPGVVRNGYDPPYSLSVIASASALGILVPPCIVMIVLGSIAQISVTTLFMAGFLPAAVMGVLVLALIGVQAATNPRYRQENPEKTSLRLVLQALRGSVWAAGVPVIIFGGILLGVATATEIGAFAVVYTLLVGLAVYRKVKPARIWKIVVDSAVATGMVTLILGLANIFAFILATQGVPAFIADTVIASGMPPWVFMLVSALVFIFIGSAVDGIASLLIFVPVFLPVVAELGVNPVHYITVTVLATGMGLLLPPAGMGIIMACAIGKVRMEEIFRPYAPFFAVLLVGVLVLIFFPQITLVVPRMMGLPGV